MDSPSKINRKPHAHCRNPWLGILFAYLVSFGGNAHAQITLDFDFDSGSLDLANSSVNGNMVNLAGRFNFHDGDRWKWIHFQADNVNGQQVTFQIGDNFVTGGSNLEDHAMVYSYDKVNWEFFENNNRDEVAGTYTFSNNSAFSQDQVYVAYSIPYPYQRSVAHTASIASSPWVSPTISANANLVLGQSPGGIDELGRTIAPRDMHGFKITDPSVTTSKSKVVLLAGVHANEVLSNYMLEGLIEFLVSDDTEAAMLRKKAEFFVYPMANPDGRFAGYNRSTVEFVDLDPNRHWEPFAATPYGGQSDIQLIGDSMIADTGGDIDFFLDFHGTVQGKDGHFAFVVPEQQTSPFWLNVQALDPSIGTRDSPLTTFNSARFGRDVLNAEFTSSFETQFINGDNIDRFYELGRTYGVALEQTLRTLGDLNYDGAVNTQDWGLFIAGAETDLSGLSGIEAFIQGDLDGDGVNSVLDFALFKQAFINANGAAAFAMMVAQVVVPEPSSALMLVCGILITTLNTNLLTRRSFS